MKVRERLRHLFGAGGQGAVSDSFCLVAAGSVTVLINGREVRQKGQVRCRTKEIMRMIE